MLAVLTFAGPTEERRAERSITRGDEQGDNISKEINEEMESQSAACSIWMGATIFKRGRIHNWINYSSLTVSFSTVCLTGLAVCVFLVRRNRCVPGRLLNTVLGAEACLLWQCCNKYQPSLLGHPLIPVQCAALLVGVCFSLTHSESLKNLLHLSLVCQTRVCIWHLLLCSSLNEKKHCSGFFSSTQSAWENLHSFPLCFLPFCLPVPILSHTWSPSLVNHLQQLHNRLNLALYKKHKENHSPLLQLLLKRRWDCRIVSHILYCQFH